MGDIADMMLDGTLCQTCGEYVGGDGFPTLCRGCAPGGRKRQPAEFATPKNHTKVACPACGRHVKKVGLADHVRDAHGVTVGKT